jgi:hypothetical protein
MLKGYRAGKTDGRASYLGRDVFGTYRKTVSILETGDLDLKGY